MPDDDLSKLAPIDPSRADPQWPSRRSRILDDILDDILADAAPRHRAARRWVAGVAAAALAVVAVGGMAQLQDRPYATPAAPSPRSFDTPPAGLLQPVALEGYVMDVDGTMGICYGSLDLSSSLIPRQEILPSCLGGFVPVVGLPMPPTPERSGVLVGTFDGSVFHAARLYHHGQQDVPRNPMYTMPPEPPDICEEKSGTGASTDEEEFAAAAEKLPGYQGHWLLSDLSFEHHRVAVTHGAEAAQVILLEDFALQLCVGTVPGPDAATLGAAERAVEGVWPREDGQLEPFVETDVWAEATGTSLRVTVLQDTREIRAQVKEAVGPEVWPWTTVIPRLFPVDATALESPAPTATPMPPGPATPLVITDQERRWAQQYIAADLLDAVGDSATARMAKATFEQYEALWSIDVPHPPGPPPGDTEVLIVVLSADLENRATRGGPAVSPQRSATGTLSVIDAATGESIIYATLLGDGSPVGRLSRLPGPVEDVALPEGFR